MMMMSKQIKREKQLRGGEAFSVFPAVLSADSIPFHMAATIPTRSSGCSVFLLLSVLSICTVSLVNSQPQNIEVYFPFPLPTPLLSPPPPPPPSLPPPPLPPPPPPPAPGKTSSGSTKTIATAVAVTAASTVVVSAVIFFVLRRRAMSRGQNGESRHGPSGGLPVLSRDELSRFDGHVKGLIVDENGLDVLYWRQLQGSMSRSPRRRSSFMRSEVVMASPEDGGEPEAEEGLGRRIQEVPLLLGKPSTSERNSSPTRPQLTLTLPPPVVPPPPAVNIEAKIGGGSIKADDDLMEALFGYVATNRKTPRGNNSSSPGHLISGLEGQIFILDARKSQDIAVVLRSLSVSRKDIINALLEGQGLDSDTLGKLSQIAPTREEELKILAFGADPTRLADAESFLFHILKAIPSAFTRFGAMLLRRNYESEILQVRESITTVELGCSELQAGGLLAKLLQAILKAGNRMNPGTARALNISALKKLSDVKSTDGNTTLLHFVVEEVVRSEGRRCAINGARSMSRSGSFASMNSENPASKDAREKEYVMLGLPIVGGLSAKFSNVKKAASIDYESFAGLCGALQSRVSEIRQLVSRCEGGGGGFVTEMRGFLESADAEIASLRKDQAGAVELVKETAEHYQAGASKEKGSDPIKLFIIVRDFLGMVDRICIEIAREVQKKKPTTASAPTETPRKTMRFPKLPSNFLSDTESNGSVHDL